MRLRDINARGQELLSFHHLPAWLHCSSPIAIGFLTAACIMEEDAGQWQFGAVLQHSRCPLCGLHDHTATSRWAHLLCDCMCKPSCASPAACTGVGIICCTSCLQTAWLLTGYFHNESPGNHISVTCHQPCYSAASGKEYYPAGQPRHVFCCRV